MDKLHMALTELSYSINYVAQINVWDYTFAPRYEMPFDEFFQSGNIVTTTLLLTCLHLKFRPRPEREFSKQQYSEVFSCLIRDSSLSIQLK